MKAKVLSIHNMAKDRLFDDILDQGIELRMQVSGSSMAPVIQTGDMVDIKRFPASSLQVGDLILFKIGGKLVLHRILLKKRMNDDRFLFRTKGDAVKSLDEPVDSSQVLGRVVGVLKKEASGEIKFTSFDSARERRQNRLVALRHLAFIALAAATGKIKKSLPFHNTPKAFIPTGTARDIIRKS